MHKCWLLTVSQDVFTSKRRGELIRKKTVCHIFVDLFSLFQFDNIEQAFKHQQGRGLDIIFVLDTSASMEGEGMRQMKGAVTDILNGNCDSMRMMKTFRTLNINFPSGHDVNR